MNQLKIEKKVDLVKGLVEGCSIRSLSRMHDTQKNTITKLLYRVGKGCEKLLDERMNNLECKSIQCDEIWTYVGKKQKQLTDNEKKFRLDLGDQYVFVALDAETKLIPVFQIGKRSTDTATKLMLNLEKRLNNRVQITTDAFKGFRDATDIAFGINTDFAQLHKTYKSNGERRYSPPEITAVFNVILSGRPTKGKISTSFVERQNLTMRMQMRRFTRLTNGFSKKFENLKSAVALHFAHYNFCRIHKTLSVTPAMEAGITKRLWDIKDLLEWEIPY